MKKILFYLMFAPPFLIVFWGCKKTCGEPAIPILNLKILYYSDSTNYIFGTKKKYDFTSLKFYSLKGVDTLKINASVVNNFEKPIANDSIIAMVLSETFNQKIFIKYPSNHVDSFDIHYSVYSNKCGTSANIGRVWYGGYEIYTGTYNFFSIYK